MLQNTDYTGHDRLGGYERYLQIVKPEPRRGGITASSTPAFYAHLARMQVYCAWVCSCPQQSVSRLTVLLPFWTLKLSREIHDHSPSDLSCENAGQHLVTTADSLLRDSDCTQSRVRQRAIAFAGHGVQSTTCEPRASGGAGVRSAAVERMRGEHDLSATHGDVQHDGA